MKKVNLDILKKIWKNLGSSEEQNQGINQLSLALVFSKVMKENSWQSKRNMQYCDKFGKEYKDEEEYQ